MAAKVGMAAKLAVSFVALLKRACLQVQDIMSLIDAKNLTQRGTSPQTLNMLRQGATVALGMASDASKALKRMEADSEAKNGQDEVPKPKHVHAVPLQFWFTQASPSSGAQCQPGLPAYACLQEPPCHASDTLHRDHRGLWAGPQIHCELGRAPASWNLFKSLLHPA
eukprot:scaffold207617_cov19-Tisochrysis_lutea.AAC.1